MLLVTSRQEPTDKDQEKIKIFVSSVCPPSRADATDHANLCMYFTSTSCLILSCTVQLHQGQASTGVTVVVADEQQGVDLEWTVGGAFEVDMTQVGGMLYCFDDVLLARCRRSPPAGRICYFAST